MDTTRSVLDGALRARRLKVAHLVPFMHLGGTERVILDLCRHGKEEQKVVATVDGPMRAVFEEHGIPVEIVEDPGELAPSLAAADLVNLHCLEYLPELVDAILHARRPMVCTLHWQSVLPPMPGPVICVARHVYDLQEPNRDGRLLIANGIDTTRFVPARGRPERSRILRVCRPDKCADYFWPALYRVLDACPAAELMVVGGPPYEAGRVRSPGYRSDVETLFAEAEVFAYAPRPWEGAMDLVVLEAMASGLPCVLSDVPCVSEAVEHGVTGFLTPYEDVEAFAACLERLLRDPDLRRQMGERAAQVARERFDIRDRAPLYSAAYARAITEGPAPVEPPTHAERR